VCLSNIICQLMDYNSISSLGYSQPIFGLSVIYRGFIPWVEHDSYIWDERIIGD